MTRVPALLLAIFKVANSSVAGISSFNFELLIFSQMYVAYRSNGSKGQVKLNSVQYQRLVCAAHLFRSFCSSEKKKSATKRASDQATVSTVINEGGEEIKL